MTNNRNNKLTFFQRFLTFPQTKRFFLLKTQFFCACTNRDSGCKFSVDHLSGNPSLPFVLDPWKPGPMVYNMTRLCSYTQLDTIRSFRSRCQTVRVSHLLPCSTKHFMFICLSLILIIFHSSTSIHSHSFFCHRLIQLLEVLDLGIKLFEYQPRKKVALASAKGGNPSTVGNTHNTENKERLKTLENAIMNPTAARDMLRRRKEMESIRGKSEEGFWISHFGAVCLR